MGFLVYVGPECLWCKLRCAVTVSWGYIIEQADDSQQMGLAVIFKIWQPFLSRDDVLPQVKCSFLLCATTLQIEWCMFDKATNLMLCRQNLGMRVESAGTQASHGCFAHRKWSLHHTHKQACKDNVHYLLFAADRPILRSVQNIWGLDSTCLL